MPSCISANSSAIHPTESGGQVSNMASIAIDPLASEADGRGRSEGGVDAAMSTRRNCLDVSVPDRSTLPCCRERSLALHASTALGGSRKRRELNVAVSSPRSDFGVESGSTATVQIGHRCILFELPPSRKHQAFGLVIIDALFEGWFVVY